MREMSSFPMICLFKVPGARLSRHAIDIRKIYEGQSFKKTQVNGGTTTN